MQFASELAQMPFSSSPSISPCGNLLDANCRVCCVAAPLPKKSFTLSNFFREPYKSVSLFFCLVKKNVSLSAEARSADALVKDKLIKDKLIKDKLTSNCHFFGV